MQMACSYDKLHLGPLCIKRFYACIIETELQFLRKGFRISHKNRNPMITKFIECLLDPRDMLET